MISAAEFDALLCNRLLRLLRGIGPDKYDDCYHCGRYVDANAPLVGHAPDCVVHVTASLLESSERRTVLEWFESGRSSGQ